MNSMTLNTDTATPVKAGRVDTSRGSTIIDASMQWMRRPADERYLSLDDMHATALKQHNASDEAVIDVKNIALLPAEDIRTKDDLNKLQVGLNGVEGGNVLDMTHWSFGQLAGLAGAPAGYMRQLPSTIVADAMEYGLRYNRTIPDAKMYFSEGNLLAATGAGYGRIPNHEVIQALRNIAGNGADNAAAWRVPGVMSWQTMMYDPFVPVSADTTTLFMSDRDMFAFLTDPHHPIVVGKTKEGLDDVMYRGFIVSQSEVGGRSLKLKAFLFRGACCNRIIWGASDVEEISIRHSKGAPDRWLRQVEPALIEYSKSSSMKIVEAVQRSKAAVLAKDDDQMIDWLVNKGMSRKRSLDVLKAVETEEGTHCRTVWDATQGITAVARSIPYQDERVEMEDLGGKVFGLTS
jgi:hypothetical protein